MKRSLSICWILLLCTATLGGAKEPLQLVDHLPRDPLIAGVFDVGDPAEALRELLATLQRFDTEGGLDAVESDIAEFEAELGCSVRDDVLAQIGPEIAFSFDLPPVDELLAGMEDPAATLSQASAGTGLVARVRDGKRLEACLDRLAARAGLTVSREDGMTRLVLSQGDPAADGAPLQEASVHYAISGAKMALSAASGFVRTSLASRPEGSRLFDGTDFQRVFTHLEATPAGLTYINLPKLQLRISESEFVQGMLAGNEEAQPILEMIASKEFTGMGIGTTAVEIDGGVRRMSYGPKALSGGISSVGVVAAILVPNLIDALEKAKRKRTVGTLRSIAAALEALAGDEGGAYPSTEGEWRETTTLSDALAPTYLAAVPATDGWGHRLLYWSDGERYLIASPGKDDTMDRDWLAGSGTIAGEPAESWELDLVFDGSSLLVASDG